MRDLINIVEDARFASPAFQSWFSGSKVVDKQGRPLVVYHGAASDFHTFDAGKTRFAQDKGAFFFTSGDHIASAYADEQDDGRVMEVYLALKNPLVLHAQDGQTSIEEWDYSDGKIRDAADAQGHDGVIITGDDGDTLFVAFHSTQIKSVKNVGRFDGTNPNINEDAPRDL